MLLMGWLYIGKRSVTREPRRIISRIKRPPPAVVVLHGMTKEVDGVKYRWSYGAWRVVTKKKVEHEE